MHDKQQKQLDLLNSTITHAKKSNLYSSKLKGHHSQLTSLSAIQKLPFTTKQDLRDHYPFGYMACNIEEVIEVHTSSGTTGKATLALLTKEDIIIGSKVISEAWKAFGATNQSRVQFMMSYGLFSGAMLNTFAIQELGALVVPSGAQTTAKQVELMLNFETDAIVATPGYYFHLHDYLVENNISPSNLKLKWGVAAGEVYSEKTRAKIEQMFGIKVFDHYGLCEINTGIAYECEYRSGLHVLDEYVLPEIIDPETGTVLPEDSEGELVLTTLRKQGTPLIRYRTGDITNLKSGKCVCGKNNIQIGRILRRTDDILFIKGIKIDPHELREYIQEVMGDSITGDTKILVQKPGGSERSSIFVSLRNPSDTHLLDVLRKAIKEKTLITFSIYHVKKDYFDPGENTKVKFFEHAD